MKKYLTICIKRKGKQYDIFFGIPDAEEEINQMKSLRYKTYLKKGHIKENISGLDSDFYDEHNLCYYFIATCNNQVIGSTRMIYGNRLPTLSEYFRLDIPYQIKNYQISKIVEIGRLASSPPENLFNIVPRHLVLLGLFLIMTRFAEGKGYLIAVGSLKDYIKCKLEKIKFPLHVIDNFELIYKPHIHNDPLVNFFAENSGKVWPLFVMLDEVKKYLNSIFQNKFCFEVIDSDHLVLRRILYFNIYLFIKGLTR